MSSRIAVAVLAVLALAAGLGASAARPNQTEQAFVQGGQIFMDLSAGQYVIRGTEEPKIRLECTTREAADLERVRVNVGVNGKTARIDTDGPSDHFRCEVDVPKRADLTIRLSAGDLSIGGIEGHKDVSAWAGDLKIDVGRAADYRKVAASVTAGDLRADAFEVVKEGIFRSFSQERKGKYDLNVRLTAGKIELREDAPAAAAEAPLH